MTIDPTESEETRELRWARRRLVAAEGMADAIEAYVMFADNVGSKEEMRAAWQAYVDLDRDGPSLDDPPDAQAAAQVAAVRTVHHVEVIQTTGGPREMCAECFTGDPFCTVSNDWPCPTIAALDAAEVTT